MQNDLKSLVEWSAIVMAVLLLNAENQIAFQPLQLIPKGRGKVYRFVLFKKRNYCLGQPFMIHSSKV